MALNKENLITKEHTKKIIEFFYTELRSCESDQEIKVLLQTLVNHYSNVLGCCMMQMVLFNDYLNDDTTIEKELDNVVDQIFNSIHGSLLVNLDLIDEEDTTATEKERSTATDEFEPSPGRKSYPH